MPFQDACAPQSDSFSVFVDEYLDGFARRHPSIAAGNGIHDHDALLDDFSADAIEREIAELKAARARLREFVPENLTPDERVDQRILDGIMTVGCWSRKRCRTGVAIRCSARQRCRAAYTT